MRSDYFELFRKGIAGELDLLALPDKLEHFACYHDLFLLDASVLSTYINAILKDKDFGGNDNATRTFLHCLNMAHSALPTNSDLLSLLNQVSPSEERAVQYEIEQAFTRPESREQALERLMHADDPKELYDALFAELHEKPANITAAASLLQADYTFYRQPKDWLSRFKCPKRLLPLWNAELFLHYAKRGLHNEALELWPDAPDVPDLPGWQKSPYTLAHAADMLIMAGDTTAGMDMYRKALSIDGSLSPLRRRLAELESPRQPRPELLRERATAICLYSWNKGELLEQTLRALARCDIGANPVFVLLNGCTDDSKARMEAVRELFPNNPFTIINLPVNVGAPAARNWLINLPEVQAADYVAFMDDDVVMQADWLIRYLTEIELNPKHAVVGCKVIFPPVSVEEAPAIQYMFRSISLTIPGALKLTLPALNERDTGRYAFSRPSASVMGCLHLLRVSALKEVGGFDLRFSPSQVDDLDHDLCTLLKGYNVVYCGTVTCEHHQNSGVGAGRSGGRIGAAAVGSIYGNDLKLNYKHLENLATLRSIAVRLRMGKQSS